MTTDAATQLAPRSRKYTQEQIEVGLRAVVVAQGNRREASRLCGVPEATLRSWVEIQHPERYAQLQKEESPRIYDRIAAKREQMIDLYLEGAEALAKRVVEEYKDIPIAQAPRAAQSLETAAAIAQDKARVIRGEPTEIRRSESFQDVIKTINRRFGKYVTFDKALTVDSTAVEIKEEK